MEAQKKSNFIRDYWPQLTAVVAILLLLGQMYSEFNTVKSELREYRESQEKMWEVFAEKIDKTISILNDEDDGVRGDFGVGDKHLQENIENAVKYEALRSEKDKLEMKVWHYENK